MQKGKHQGGQTQGYSHRNYPAYPGNPDTSRQYTREVPAFQASGTPGGGPGMRGMHHAPPTQPPTPPTSQDIKQAPTHIPPQSHPMPPQSGGQIMYTMTGAGRSSSQQPQVYNAQRAGVQRLPPRSSILMPNNPTTFLHQPAVQQVYPNHLVSPVAHSMILTQPLNQAYQFQAQQRHQGNIYGSPYMMTQTHQFIPGSFQQVYYQSPGPQIARTSGPAPNSQAPHPQSAGVTVMPGTTATMIPQHTVEVAKQNSRRLKIIDPKDGRDIWDDLLTNNNTPPKSGESSARQTPQPNSENKRDVAAEFATRVALAAKSDQSGSPNSPSLQQPSSRASNYSENESQASPDMQGMSMPSVSPSKIDISVDNISSESQIVENNMTYNANQQPTMVRAGWSQLDIMPDYPGLIMSDEMMRGGAPPAQLAREYQSMQNQWISESNPVPVSLIISSKEPPNALESSARPGPERPTPVVSALASGPMVDISPRHPREQFSAVVKGHQQPSPQKRKQRSEASQEQAEVKGKDSQQQPPQPQQLASQPKSTTQSKPKQQTPTVESKKQSMPPSQDSDDHVQSVQTKNSESKTISIKVNEADSSESKVKSNDSLINKENNNLETRNLNEEIIQDNNNRNKSESVKSEVVLPVEGSAPPRTEESSGKYRARPVEEIQEVKDAFPAEEKFEAKVDSNTTEADVTESKWTSRANGEQIAAEKLLTQTDTSPHALPTDTKGTSGLDITPPESKLKPNGENVEDVMEDWRSSNCLTNGFEHYSSYNGRSSWGGRANRVHSRPSSRASSRPNSRRGSKDFSSTEFIAKQNTQKQKPGNKRQGQSKMKLEKEVWNAEQPEPVTNEVTPAPTPAVPKAKSPPPPAVDSGQMEQAQLQEDAVTDEEKQKEKVELIVVAKNEENNKQTASLKTNDTTNSPVSDNISKMVLKRNYKKDQWSPLNPEGKKKYDREFILELMDDPQSRRKPPNLPHIDLLKDNTKQRPSDRNFLNPICHDSSDNVLWPAFGNKNSIQRSSQTLQKKGSQTSKPKGAKPHVIHMSLHQDVKLHETENAWKPSRSTVYNNLTEEEIKTEELYKRVRSVLNKLTPEKFSTLVEQLKNLPIDNHERLQGVIDLVFEKAVDEPSFSVAYAQMCSSIQHIQIYTDDGQGKRIATTFKKLLITRCQMEFEKVTSVDMKRKEAEIEQETDPEKKKLLQLMYEEEERRIRMKSVGNSRFIGELYKLKMLTCNIMHQCIEQLLREGDEESLECLCKLLTTVGEGMEKEAALKGSEFKDGKKNEPYKDLNVYFKRLADIAKNKGSKKVSSRVRFMIQDLIDLKRNNWVPRRDDSNPKTIDQIQKEADRESMEINLALNSSQERNKRQDSRNSMDYRKRGGGADSAGWTTIPPRTKYFDSDKLKLDHSEVDVGSSVSLGNRKQFAMWGHSGGGKMDTKKMPQMGNNMYAVLNEKTSQPSSRNSSFKGSSISDKDRVLSSYKSNYDDEGRSSRSSSQQGPDSSSRDSASSKYEDRRFMNSSSKSYTPHKSASNSSPESKSPEVQLKKAQLILQEYSSCSELEESEYSSKKILEEIPAPDFVVNLIRASMDLSGLSPKRAVGKIVNHLLKRKIITKKDLMEGLLDVLGSANDLALDFPLFWTYIAELMVEIFAEGNMCFRDLAELLKPRQGSSDAAKLLTSFFSSLVKEKSETWVQEAWLLSNVSLSDIIKERDVDNFVEQNKLGFLLSKKSLESVNMEAIGSELKRMMSSKTDFDTVWNWIDRNVPRERSSKPEFVRTLMTVLLEVSVIGQSTQQNTYKLDENYFSHYSQLILKYTDHNEKLELPCLYAIQAFIVKLTYPQGLLGAICHSLWEAGIIASESFMLWLEDKSPPEKEGHGVCAKSLRSFITEISENMTDDES